MNQIILNKMINKYNALFTFHNNSDISGIEYAKQKKLLFNEYCSYEEEFKRLAQLAFPCYFYCMEDMCRGVKCHECTHQFKYDVLIRKVNHVI